MCVCLQLEGMIEPIQFSNWAAPIVPIVKQDGSIRISRDYKVTTNCVAMLDKYPITCIDKLFALLSTGGQRSQFITCIPANPVNCHYQYP